MRRSWIIAALCVSAICGAFGVVVVYQQSPSVKPAHWVINTQSPNAKFRVSLKGNTKPPAAKYYAHGSELVTYSVRVNDRPIFDDIALYAGDEYDDLFLDLYPAQEWIGEETLRLGVKGNSKNVDQIQITNNSSHNIDVLETRFGNSDFFLTFGLIPKQQIKITAAAQTDEHHDTSGLRCAVRSQGKLIENTMGFDIRGKYRGSATYVIEIQDSAILISSDQFHPIDLNKRN